MPLVLPAHRVKIRYSLDNFLCLSAWEQDFLEKIGKSAVLSEKQLFKIDEIYENLRFPSYGRMRYLEETWVD